ncbi:hypothetical protein Acsp06_40180 [Actinomycetospora sp. NBRC 106375]|uniref:metallophosphoesterase family protein n=1 Tax=Actinomycetospora sp. NBRC 106375 TaxID=3032207 RepID=UPI0024A0CACF|nr:metallophosphoesterase [Actinomycetospora sp. NBRC 106375]GLZ47833.1 hypothetical protein Acsp06_40180 [Actinomycetospora sp. NBRC 106375]
MEREVEPPQRPAVRWLSPVELARTGIEVAIAGVVTAYSDKRDVMSGTTFTQEPAAFTAAPGEEFWLDFLADTGDGFAPTCTVATLLGRPALEVDGHDLPRGRLLLLGGDEVYPVAGVRAYEERLEAPLTGQFVPGAEQPTVLAIPGNHDWYDGLTAFLRVFCQGRDLAAWRTQQRRSYFAASLPHGWWVLAIDIQLDTYIDATQLEWFRAVVDRMSPGDRIILCTATPAWYGAEAGSEHAMDRLAFFLREILAGHDHPVRLVLTGDTHHYARYALRRPGSTADPDDEEQVLVTAGHGGAYTSATHFLEPALDVTTDLADPGPHRSHTTHRYELGPRVFPTARESRLEAWRVLYRLPWRNGAALLLLLAVLQGLVIVPAVLGLRILVGVGAVVVAGVCFGLVAPQRPGAPRKILFTALLALPELIVAGVSVWVARALGGALAATAVVLVAGLVASVVLAAFFLAYGRWTNRNELFAAQSIEDHKGFLRLRIAPDGTLTVYALGVERVPRRWRWSAGATPRWSTEQNWSVHLVDEPFVLDPRQSLAEEARPRDLHRDQHRRASREA